MKGRVRRNQLAALFHCSRPHPTAVRCSPLLTS